MDCPSSRPGGWADPTAPSIPAPLRLHSTTVPPAWVDYNEHMSEWGYLLVMGDSSDAFFRFVGVDDDYRAAGASLFTVETHIRNLLEVALGDELSLSLQVLGVDAKRVHIAHSVLRTDASVVATGEQLLLHVDTTRGRAAAMPHIVRNRVEQIVEAHLVLGVPEWIGRPIAAVPRASAPAVTAPTPASD